MDEAPLVADLIDHGDRELLVKSVEDAQSVITEFEQRTHSRFAVRTCIKNFGKTEVNLKSKRIFWDSTSVGENSSDLKVKYIPYAILGLKLFDCHYGKRTHPPKKAAEDEQGGASRKRRRSQPTKKLGCPAKLNLRDVVYFPNYMIQSDTKYYKEVTSRRLRFDWEKKDFIDYVRYIRISLPSQDDHVGHPTGEICGPSERIDPKVSKKIEELVGEGVDNVKDMRRHLEFYVRKQLFPGRFKPLHSNTRFFPNKKAVKNKMYKTFLKKRFSKIDVDNLTKSIQEWSEQNPTDKFFFRPYSEVDVQYLREEGSVSCEVDGDEIRIPLLTAKQNLLFVHQTSFQQYLLHKYGNFACFLDATYKTIKYSLPLYFLVVKTNVDYQVVATIVIQDGGKDFIQEALQLIKSWNPNVNPTVFFSDLDKEEIHAIQETFETSAVLICDFHREQAWDCWLSKVKNGVTAYKNAILVLLQQLAKARTEEDFVNATNVLQNADVWNTSFGAKFKSWFENTWLPEKERWVWAYKKEVFSIISTANNEHERQRKDFNRDFLTNYKDTEMSNMLKVLIESFLPEKENIYYELNADFKYPVQVPDYLQDRPREIVKYLMEKISLAADIHEDSIEFIDEDSGVFMVKNSQDERLGYCVFFGSTDTMPYCQCIDWENTLLPCQHFFAIIKKYEQWSWLRLPELYRSSPYLNLDRICPMRIQQVEDSDVACDEEILRDEYRERHLELTETRKSKVSKAAACRALISEINSLIYTLCDERALSVAAEKLDEVLTDLKLAAVDDDEPTVDIVEDTDSGVFKSPESHKQIVKLSRDVCNNDHDYQMTNEGKEDKGKIQAIPLNVGKRNKVTVKQKRSTESPEKTISHVDMTATDSKQSANDDDNEVLDVQAVEEVQSFDEYLVDTCDTLEKVYHEEEVSTENGDMSSNSSAKRIRTETETGSDENEDNDYEVLNEAQKDVALPAEIRPSLYEESLIKQHEMLTDESINIVHAMLKRKFPSLAGLQDASMDHTSSLNVLGRGKKYVQVLHDGNLHWVCISNIVEDSIRPRYHIDVYDSLNHGYIPKTIKQQIASLLKIREPHMRLCIQPVQQQSNDVDSGVYAAAFATALSCGKDPCDLVLDANNLRQHFLTCVKLDSLDLFPVAEQKKRPIFSRKKELLVELFCTCRMPYTKPRKQDENMVQCRSCEEWYHQKCEQIPREFFDQPQVVYKCKECKNRANAKASSS